MRTLSERVDVWRYGRTGAPRARARVCTSVLLFLLLLLFGAACDTAGPGDYEPAYVVEAYLVADEPLPQVRLSRTAPVNTAYDFSSLAVRGAEVALNLLADDGTVEERYRLVEDAARPGVYVPERARLVRPLRTYALDVILPATGDRITARTTVPDVFRVVEANATEVTYQSDEQLALRITRSTYPGRDQMFLIFVTESLDPREEQLTPFASALYEEGVELEELRIGASPIFNEANYDVNPDGTLTIEYPWLAVSFFGLNEISALAIDDNLYDYIRSQSVQQGGSTFSPGEIPNPIERVEGAHGVFGSYARIFYHVTIRRAAGT